MPASKRPDTVSELKPYWQSECGRAIVYVGKCENILPSMEPSQFHAVVTDPPYGLEFMGKDWDSPWKQSGRTNDRRHRAAELANQVKAKYIRHNVIYGASDPQGFQVWFQVCAEAILRVAKPGAHILSFGGTRMWHRMTCGAEDAGWEIRDTIMWVYGTGFPKGRNVSKAIDKELGFKRTDVITRGTAGLSHGNFNSDETEPGGYGYSAEYNVMAPVTCAAQQWQGWNTALKPAVEPILLARKPMHGTVAECTLEHGTGALNIDACKVGTTNTTTARHIKPKISSGSGVYKFNTGDAGTLSMNGNYLEERADGNYPPNFIHDGSDDVTELLPDYQARMFYSPKAGSEDRPHGEGATVHPTVKPLDLMCYLVRLVCVPGGIVLDPFTGSGSTGCAAILEGMRFVGIEQSQEYADIAVGRLKLALAERIPSDTPDAPAPFVHRVDNTPPPPKKLWDV